MAAVKISAKRKPAKKTTRRKAAKKAVKKKVARKRVVRKVARKVARKRTRRVARKVVAKKVVRKTAKKSTRKKKSAFSTSTPAAFARMGSKRKLWAKSPVKPHKRKKALGLSGKRPRKGMSGI